MLESSVSLALECRPSKQGPVFDRKTLYLGDGSVSGINPTTGHILDLEVIVTRLGGATSPRDGQWVILEIVRSSRFLVPAENDPIHELHVWITPYA